LNQGARLPESKSPFTITAPNPIEGNSDAQIERMSTNFMFGWDNQDLGRKSVSEDV
jgi:hypothetical protein